LTAKGLEHAAISHTSSRLGSDQGSPVGVDADPITIVVQRKATAVQKAQDFVVRLEQEFNVVGITGRVAEHASGKHLGSHVGIRKLGKRRMNEAKHQRFGGG
jgi:hypothetical protein